ncbi:MAG: efflux RND transporter periplasmic adaptor subunit [Gemmatimonadaceae bacterium]
MNSCAARRSILHRTAIFSAAVIMMNACEGSQARQVTAEHPASVTASADQPKAFTLDEAQRSRIVLQTVAESKYRPTLEATATVMFNGDHSTQVLAPISGPVARILVNPGARVRRGQLLATVASPDFASAVAEFRKTDAASRNSQRILTQNEALFKNDALSRRELEQSQADAAAATADVDAATEALRSLGVDSATIAAVRDGQSTGPLEAGIRSPLDGTVVEKLVSPGQLLQAGGSPTFTVADLSTVWVMASIFESDLAVVQAGEVVEVLTDASTTPLRGRVDYVAALVDPASKATQVRIVVPNTGELLKRDMFVRVRIHANTDRRGILLPAAAVMRDEENLPFVFVGVANGGYARRRVTLGGRSGMQYEITSGLTAGEKVVSDGALFIQFAESQ